MQILPSELQYEQKLHLQHTLHVSTIYTVITRGIIHSLVKGKVNGFLEHF
jgi:hypothetical protein